MLVYSDKLMFNKKDTSCHFNYYFCLDKEYKTLKISYKYYPKQYEDRQDSRQQIIDCYARYGMAATEEQILSELPLNNHITLSLTAPNGIVGTAHRHANEAVYNISPSVSDYGFLPTKIVKGIWAITLSAHAILSPTVTAFLEVEVYD